MPRIYRKKCDKCGQFYESWNKRFCRECSGVYKAKKGYKWCSCCGKDKPLNEFNVWKKSKDGLRNHCKECQRNSSNIYYKIKTEKETHHFVYKSIRTRFKSGIDIAYGRFRDWYKNQLKICHYCGIPEETYEHIAELRGYGKRGYRRLQVDRKDNDLGYQERNICLACPTCNKVKNNVFSEKEMLEIGKKYIVPKWKKEILSNEREDSPCQLP